MSYNWAPQVPMPFGKGRKPCNQPGRPDVMFPDPKDADGIAEAKFICGFCDVQEQCLAYAMEFPPAKDHGVWGGTTEAERRSMRRRLRAARKANAASVWPRPSRSTRTRSCWAGPPV